MLRPFLPFRAKPLSKLVKASDVIDQRTDPNVDEILVSIKATRKVDPGGAARRYQAPQDPGPRRRRGLRPTLPGHGSSEASRSCRRRPQARLR